MKTLWKIITAKIIIILMMGAAFYVLMSSPHMAAAMSDWQQPLLSQLNNAKAVSPTLMTGGTLKKEATAAFAQEGVKLVIDTRLPEEGTAEEMAKVEAAGMDYLNIPIRSDISDEMIMILRQALRDHAGQPVVLHCRSGRRAEMLWAAYQRMSETPE